MSAGVVYEDEDGLRIPADSDADLDFWGPETHHARNLDSLTISDEDVLMATLCVGGVVTDVKVVLARSAPRVGRSFQYLDDIADQAFDRVEQKGLLERVFLPSMINGQLHQQEAWRITDAGRHNLDTRRSRVVAHSILDEIEASK